jgi:hypothetical protein
MDVLVLSILSPECGIRSRVLVIDVRSIRSGSAKAMHIIIAKCGYDRHTKQEIIYGPLELGGANFCHLYLQQGIGLVTSFLLNWRNNSVTGQQLHCALSWTQMTAGTLQSILIDVHSALPHLVSKWLASLRTFLSKIEATIELESPIHLSWTILSNQNSSSVSYTSGRLQSRM